MNSLFSRRHWIATALALALGFTAATHAAEDARTFELRIYVTNEGKLPDLLKRFRDHTCKLFEKHGMENIGYWLPIHNEQNQLVYVLAYPNLAAREAAWKAFGSDPEWKKVQQASEANGKIVNKVDSYFMAATDFSPKIRSSKKKNRVFELRTYTAGPGKLDDLQTRFRNHTLALFEKYDMVNIAYWTTIEKEKVQPKLVYILAHDSEEKGKQMFENFRKSPEWVKIKGESEKNGVLAEKVESVYMRALKFSRIR